MTTGPRKRVFAAAAVLLLGLAVVLTAHGRDSENSRQTRTHPSSSAAAIAATASTHITVAPHDSVRSSASPPRTPRTAGKEREAKRAPTVAPREAHGARAAARAFLNGYLRYSYGRTTAGEIRASTPRLVRALEAAPPRVPATVARAHPRLISVRAQATTGNAVIRVLALVDDGQRRYAVALAVRDVHGRWVVTEISG